MQIVLGIRLIKWGVKVMACMRENEWRSVEFWASIK